MSSDITEAQQDFIQAIQDEANQQLSSLLDGTFEVINYPNGFFWGIQFGPNNYYNANALQQVDLQASTGSNGVKTLAGTQFSALYSQILNDVAYQFSKADTAAMQTELSNADSQVQAVINSWENDAGPITTQDIKAAGCFPATKLGFIDYTVLQKFGGDVKKIPSSMNSFRMAYQTYQVAAQLVFQLQQASASAIQRVQQARDNVMTPTNANGGLQVDAGKYALAYGPFPTQNAINGGLQQSSNALTIQVDLSNFSSKTVDFSVSGSAGISIPILDVLSIDVSASSSYTMHDLAQSSTALSMKLTYPGLTIVGAPTTQGNLSTNGETGWFDNQILTEAVANVGQDRTGYALLGNQFPVDDYFGPDKKFGRVKTFVISQQPTIEMTFSGAEATAFTSDFKENASASVSLFGLFKIGEVDQSYEVQKVDTKSVSGQVTVTFGPPVPIGTTPSADASAYLVGGVLSYPPEAI